MFSTVIAAIITIVVVTVVLVALLLFVKLKLTPDGTVKIDINNGKKTLDVPQGGDLLHTLADQKIFLPSACGGKANCGQCKVQVLEGGGTILPTETGFFSRRQIKDGYRLGCQVKVKENIKIQVPESTLSVQKLECEVISNKNVATFIKEFIVALPKGEHMDFLPEFTSTSSPASTSRSTSLPTTLTSRRSMLTMFTRQTGRGTDSSASRPRTRCLLSGLTPWPLILPRVTSSS